MKVAEILEARVARVRHVAQLDGDSAGLSLAPEATLAEAAAAIAARNRGATVVRGPGQELLGVVTERDIVRAIARDGAAALDRPVSAVMTAEVRTTVPEASCRDVLVEMIEGNFRSMPVVADGRVDGVVLALEAAQGKLSEMTSEQRKLVELVGHLVGDDVACAPGDGAAQVLARIRAADLPCMPVRAAGVIVGIVTPGDILRAGVAEA